MSETLREVSVVEVLEAHQWYPGFGSCRCGWIDPVTPEGSCGTEDRHRTHLARALLAATAPTPDEGQVHNHPPYRPECAERVLPDGRLRGARLPNTEPEEGQP